MEVAEQAKGVPDGWAIVPSTPPPPPTPPSGPAVLPSGPARGRGTQFDPAQADRNTGTLYDAATTPLARPTGIDMIDSFTSPAGLASLVAGGMGIARAAAGEGVTAAGRALAGATEAMAQATPVIKYEATKTLLQKVGVPAGMAVPIAMVISGYKKGAQAAEAAAPEAAAAEAPAVSANATGTAWGSTVRPTAAPVSPAASTPGAPASPSAAVERAAAPPPTEGSGSSLPDQKALNEAALARRRAEYQARVQAESEAQAAPPKAKLLASEAPEYMRLLKAGKTHQEAMDVIEANRQLQERLGLTTPTAADTRFPKGMRGGTRPLTPLQ